MFNTDRRARDHRFVERRLRGRLGLQGQGHRLRLRDLHRRRGRLPDGDQARSSASRTRTPSTTRSSRPPSNLLKQQRENITTYWGTAQQQIDSFTSGDMVVGTTWQYQVGVLQGATPPVPVKAVKPKEGTTGWSDTWMISSPGQAPQLHVQVDGLHHRPEANAMATVWFGEAPVSQAACDEAEKLSPGHCDTVPRDRRGLLQGRLLLEHPDRRVPRRPRPHLQGLLRMDEGLDRDQGLIARDPSQRPRLLSGSRGRSNQDDRSA